MPEPPLPRCNDAHIMDEISSCKCCKNLDTWWSRFKNTVDDLLLWLNIHTCERGQKKDGTRCKAMPSASCKDNKWGKCKAWFPRPTFLKSVIDDTGAITMKKIEPWLNTFTPLVTYLFCCNTDVTSLSSRTAIKAVVMYVPDYITKTTLKTHTIFDSIWSVFHKIVRWLEVPFQHRKKHIVLWQW